MQKIKQGNLFGRIGAGIGKGLAEQLPKEIERGRLAHGLGQLSQQEGLSPFQQFSGLASLPGVTPQIIQSGAEILRQQGMSQGFQNVANQSPEQKQNQALQDIGQKAQSGQVATSANQQPGYGNFKDVATTNPVQATLNPHIPRTLQQNQIRAAELQRENPALYPLAKDALEAAIKEDQSLLGQTQALQNQRKAQQDVQKELNTQLDAARTGANAIIPDNVYQPIKNKAFDDVREGRKTEAEAADAAVKEMDKISRQYNAVKGLGNWTLPFAKSKDLDRSIENSRKEFKERNDLPNLAKSLVGLNGLSYPNAYALTYPLDEIPKLNSFVQSLNKPDRSYKIEGSTKEISPKLAELMGKEGSPLAIGEGIRLKGYDPNIWLNYLIENKRELKLTPDQVEELSLTSNWFPNMNDIWIQSGRGNDKYLEELK